ncbi:hypothetical protein BU15DRAFT_68940 [Melanogaster broomeanus]|nr:hypothetical protein BU15DRAFT_68940 [Melanogaster broomeanus]
MTSAITMWSSRERRDLTSSACFHLRTNSWRVSPASSLSSTPASSTPSSPTLYHSQSGSRASSTSPQSGPSKLEPSSAESTGLCGSSTVDPVLTIGADLEEAFDRMSKIVFGDSEGPHRPQSKYENLAQYWMDAIMIKKAAVHTLAFAQQEIENVESQFSSIIGPELVQFYSRAYYRVGGNLEDTSTALAKFKADILRAVEQLAIP